MSYESTVYRILIASPSDVDEEREVASRIIQDWNDLNSFSKKIVLLPLKWESHSSPSYGIRPQEAINKQIVDDCDLLIGFFWTKIGTPTGEDLSGTIEEIKRVSKAGKPVMLYFSKRGKDPSQIDLEQLEALNKFKDEVYKIALVENFNTIVDFRDKVSRQLEMKIRELQQKKEAIEDFIKFSFIDSSTGKLNNKKIEIDSERIDINEEQINDILKTDKRLSKVNSWHFKYYLTSYVNKKNNIPIVLGLENNVNRILGNVIAELKIKSSIENSLVIQSIGSSENDNIYNRLDDYDLSKENETNIRKLFKNNLTQISSDTWEFSPKPFTLLPNKMKVLESIMILYPKDSINIVFNINVFSENILQPIESNCELKIKLKTRKLTKEELTEIIEKLPEEDDVPF